MELQIITPEKIVFSGDAHMVTVPGADGEFGVMAGHMRFISTLREGEIVIDFANAPEQRIAVTGGVAEVTPESCTLLVEMAKAA